MSLSEERKKDIYCAVGKCLGEWYYIQRPSTFNGFDAINNEVFKPAGVNIFDLKSLSAHEVLEKILECCQKLSFSHFDTRCSLEAAACDASLIFNL